MTKDCVYILANSAMPGLFKVGITQISRIHDRRDELFRHTGVPAPFALVWHLKSEYAPEIENRLKRSPEAQRYVSNREFYAANIRTLIDMILAFEADAKASQTIEEVGSSVTGAVEDQVAQPSLMPSADRPNPSSLSDCLGIHWRASISSAQIAPFWADTIAFDFGRARLLMAEAAPEGIAESAGDIIAEALLEQGHCSLFIGFRDGFYEGASGLSLHGPKPGWYEELQQYLRDNSYPVPHGLSVPAELERVGVTCVGADLDSLRCRVYTREERALISLQRTLNTFADAEKIAPGLVCVPSPHPYWSGFDFYRTLSAHDLPHLDRALYEDGLFMEATGSEENLALFPTSRGRRKALQHPPGKATVVPEASLADFMSAANLVVDEARRKALGT